MLASVPSRAFEVGLAHPWDEKLAWYPTAASTVVGERQRGYTPSLTPVDPACVQIDPCRLASLNESKFWINKFDLHAYKGGEREGPHWSAPSLQKRRLVFMGCVYACVQLVACLLAWHLRNSVHLVASLHADSLGSARTAPQPSHSSSGAEHTAHAARLVCPPLRWVCGQLCSLVGERRLQGCPQHQRGPGPRAGNDAPAV